MPATTLWSHVINQKIQSERASRFNWKYNCWFWRTKLEASSRCLKINRKLRKGINEYWQGKKRNYNWGRKIMVNSKRIYLIIIKKGNYQKVKRYLIENKKNIRRVRKRSELARTIMPKWFVKIR